MKPMFRLKIVALMMTLLVFGSATASVAAVTGAAGPYRVALSTVPKVIPVGKVRMTLKVTDAAGKPVQGAQVRALVKMPGMNMGEKETTAAPAGKPGVYAAEAVFMMEGSYEATLRIDSPLGPATVTLPLQTGQDTATASGGFSPAILLLLVGGIVLAAYTLYRMRQTGQRLNGRAVLNRGTIGGLLLVAVMLGVVIFAIKNWRRPGAMTPIEAQAMEMNTPAPPGVAPVTLAVVERAPVESTVRYTGQAVGYNEQDVYARVQGWLTWMPLYAGDRVKRGQLLARLDTSQVEPQIAERQAAVNMAAQEASVSQKEYRQALAEVSRMRAEVSGKRDALAGAQAEIEAAREERVGAEAELASMQTMIADAEAMQEAAKADQAFKQAQLERTRALREKGAVSTEELQRDQSDAAEADAKVRQAQARLNQAKAQVRAGQAAVRRAGAMLTAAERKRQQMASEVRAADAAVRSTQAMADATREKIGTAQAGVAQARAGLSATTTARGYSEMRARMDGVVTQRLLSPGTLVNPGQAILRVAQVRPIRLQANVAEADLARIRVGAIVMARGQEGRAPVTARVTSISPAVDPVARTGVVEAVYPNADGRFVPGQYVVMQLSTGRSASTLRVPAAAIRARATPSGGVVTTQTQSYVWVAEPVSGQDNQFTVTPVDVKTGASDARYTEIVAGLQEGQQVVAAGHEYLKAGDTVADVARTERQAAAPAKTEATVEVSSKGFTPASVTLKAGVPAKLTFIRKDEENCGDVVLLPDYNITRKLPLNQPVTIEFTPRSGEIAFTCGMNMLHGKVVAK